MRDYYGFKEKARKGVVSVLFLMGAGWAVSAETVIPRGYEDARGAVVDVVNKYAYVWTGTVPGKLMKVELATLHTVKTLAFDTIDGRISFCVIDGNVNAPQRAYAYCGTDASPAKIVRVQLSDLSSQGSLSLASGENNVVSGVIDSMRGYAYFGMNTAPGRVVKVKLSNFTRAGALTFEAGENDARPAAIEMRTGNAYFGANENGRSKVVKLGIAAPFFSREGAIVLDPEDGLLGSSFYAPNTTPDGTVYFGSNGGRRIVKVAVPALQRMGHTDLIGGNAREEMRSTILLNSTLVKGFIRQYPSIKSFVKMNLAELKKVDVANIDLGKNGLPTGILDLVGGFATFVLDRQADPVTRIKITDLSALEINLDQEPEISATAGEQLLGKWSGGSPDTSISLVATADGEHLFVPGSLAMNTNYTMSLKARNVNGTALSLPLGNAITFASKPGLTLRGVGATAVELTIDPKDNPAGTWYEVEKKLEDQESRFFVFALETNSLASTLSDLTSGMRYSFRVRARNHNNSYTEYAGGLSVLLFPPQPSNATLLEVTAHTATLEWNPSNGAKNYTVMASRVDDPSRGEGFNTEKTSGTVEKLIPNTTYFLFLKASNKESEGTVGGESEFVSLGSTITLAATPEFSLDREKVGLNSVGLIIHPNGNPEGTLYEVEVQGGGNGFKLRTTSLTPTVEGLVAGTQYQFQIRAVNHGGIVTGYSSSIPVETVNPAITTVDAVRAYPVPFRPGNGHDSITFDQMPADSAVRVYSMSGTLVKEIRAGAESVLWDVKNDAGDDVASGVYLVRVSGSGGDKTFKLVVQR